MDGGFYPLPGPFVGGPQPYAGKEPIPPSGPVAQNPPLSAKALQAAQAILSAWILPDPLPQLGTRVFTQSGQGVTATAFLTGAKIGQPTLNAWEIDVPSRRILGSASNGTPVAPPSNPPIYSPLSQAILTSWGPEVSLPIPQLVLVQSGPAASSVIPPSILPNAILISWLPQDPIPLLPPKRVISGLAPSNPPIRGMRLPDGLLNSWIPPDPQPIVGAQTFFGLITLTVSPSSVIPSSTGNTLTLTGTGTHWLSTTPTITASAGTITGQVINSDTSITLTYSAPATSQTVTLTDPSTGATALLSVGRIKGGSFGMGLSLGLGGGTHIH